MEELIKESLQLFFPRMRLEERDGQQKGIEDSDFYEVLLEKNKILPFLQTLFFEERLIEIQVDGGTRLFFAALWDHPPEFEEQEQDGVAVIVEPEYQEGSYLMEMEHIVLSPLEPVSGNIKVRTSNSILLSFYTGTNAVQLGTRFLRAHTIRGSAVLLFEYPVVGRIIRDNRPFRAKLPPEADLVAQICHVGKKGESIECNIMDISSHGLALENDNLMKQFEIGDEIRLTILSSFDNPLVVNGIIRHFAKIRTKKGNSNICGIQFDLETRGLAAIIEQLFARVQRIFLRNLAERTEGQDIRLTLQ